MMKKVLVGAAALAVLAPASSFAQEGGFCEQYAEVCGEWTAETPCADWWAAAAPGEEGATEGATQACY